MFFTCTAFSSILRNDKPNISLNLVEVPGYNKNIFVSIVFGSTVCIENTLLCKLKSLHDAVTTSSEHMLALKSELPYYVNNSLPCIKIVL